MRVDLYNYMLSRRNMLKGAAGAAAMAAMGGPALNVSTAFAADDLRAARRYTVNVLDESQRETSNRFATARGNKWEGVSFAGEGVGRLPGALAAFECESHAQHDGGDHVIFVGRVVRHAARHDGRPLIFFGGRYCSLDTTPVAA